jgi:ATP-binding cassette subfamily C protein
MSTNLLNHIKFFWNNFIDKKKTIILVIISLFGSFLELVSLGAAIPLILVIVENDISNYPIVENFFLFFDANSKEQRIFISIILFLLGFFLRSIFLIYVNIFRLNYSYKLNISLSKKIHENILSQSILYFTKNKTSTLIQHNYNEVGILSGNLVSSIIQIIIDLSFFLMAIFFFIKIEPIGTMIIGSTFLLLGIIYIFSIKKYLVNFGEQRLVNNKKVLNELMQNFTAIKEIKLSKYLDYFVNLLTSAVTKDGRVGVIEKTIYDITRHIFEFLIVVVFCLLLYYFYFIMGIYALAAFRILPLLNRLIIAYQGLKFYLPALKTVNENLKLENKKEILKSSTEIKFLNKIEIKDLSYKYLESNEFTLKNVNLTINKNDIIGIYGPSGSGKTTLINIIIGLIYPYKGVIEVDGKNINNFLLDWRNNIAYVTQAFKPRDVSIEENIAFGMKDSNLDEKRMNEAIRISQLEKWVQNLPQKQKTIISENATNISGGQNQRIAIARAIYKNTDLIVLDEATAGLDNDTEDKFLEFVKKNELKKTFIIISHSKKVLSICNKIFDLTNKK